MVEHADTGLIINDGRGKWWQAPKSNYKPGQRSFLDDEHRPELGVLHPFAAVSIEEILEANSTLETKSKSRK